MKTVQTKVPGKLYIAGEYAVVEPCYSAIITTVDRFVHLNIQEVRENYGTFYSEGFTKLPIEWNRKDDFFDFEVKNSKLDYILSAIRTTEEYLVEQGIALEFYKLKITSELEHETNKKLGLGSSGAVTVVIVQGLLEYYEIEVTNLLIYKLSVLAQIKLGINSSFGDLAASTFTGWIQYTSFNREYIQKQIKNQSITSLVESTWPCLEIEQIDVSSNVQFLIGWTGSPASSNDLVGNVQAKKRQDEAEYQTFLKNSKSSVNQLIKGLASNDKILITQAISKNRHALLSMGQDTNVLIETPQLKKLIDIADKYEGVAKTSGAGGGDSGISFVFEKDSIPNIIQDWKKENIILLPLKTYQKNYDGGN